MASILTERPSDAEWRQTRLPVGAELTPAGVRFRVWAPSRRRVSVVLDGEQGEFPLGAGPDGYFEAVVPQAAAGTRYRFRLDDDPHGYPDPASRYQPEGPHGPSQVVDSRTFGWTDAAWPGVGDGPQVLYEMHVGTFTREGTWSAAAERLPHLSRLGITTIEMMPIADYTGSFGWGYDGVNWFAPTRLYGEPDDLRRFVDRAHAAGIAVILDVVYNHFGPDGNYVGSYARDYFTDRYKTDWGEALNFDGLRAGPVREYVTANAAYWIDEFHFDGLRLDATQNIYDTSSRHILADIAAAARRAAGKRRILLVGENEPQEAKLVRSAAMGGYGLDALWNDDFHHAALVALSGRAEAYYTDYRGTPQEFISSLRWGYLYQGQHYKWQKARRGTPCLDVPKTAFVSFLENHDQLANSARGLRTHQTSHPGSHRALTALLLLAAPNPMLFQGQEFAASTRFLFFADHAGTLAEQVSAGRKDFLSQFPSIADASMASRLDLPADRNTFEQSKLDWTECERHGEALAMHCELIRLRRNDPILSNPASQLEGAVLGERAFCLRWLGESGTRLLLVNLGRDLVLSPIPEPLLAEPENARWRIEWSSEDPRYGGGGVVAPLLDAEWLLPGCSAQLLTPERVEPRKDAQS